MYMNYSTAPTVPTANIAVNKSRLKVYKNAGDLPTYYLQKGQEFQIELFNPTTDVILAKIELNGKPIAQGGLVLNPGQRVFLERYIDVAKKFLFDTYDVSNTQEVKEAIKNNGDFKVSFYRESAPSYYNGTLTLGSLGSNYNQAIGGTYLSNASPTLGLTNTSSGSYNLTSYNASYDTLSLNSSQSIPSGPIKRSFARTKSLETGRVEKGSDSNQELKTVSKNFDFYAFHTIEYKLLPVSQKINTVEDINVKVYCTNCGSKLGKGHKFCGQCGTKA